MTGREFKKSKKSKLTKLFHMGGVEPASSLMILAFIAVAVALSRLTMYLICCYRFKDFSLYNFAARFNSWDSGWYRKYIVGIADNFKIINEPPRSASGQAWYAFFPLFPTLIAGIWNLTGRCLDIYYIGMLVNTILFCASEFFAYKYILLTRRSNHIAYFYIAFMSFGLYSFYFSALYTESLFLLLLVLCFYFLKKCEYIKMGLAGALMSATRNYGVMFVFVVLTELLLQYIKQDKPLHQGKTGARQLLTGFIKESISNSRLVLGTMLIPAGLFAYMSFLSYCTGDGFAFVHVQRAWGRNAKGIIINLINAVVRTFPPTFRGVALIIILSVIAYLILAEKRPEEFIWPLIIVLLSGSTALSSIPRYTVASFTFVLGFCDIYAKMNKPAKAILGILIITFELVLIKNWLAGSSSLLI